MTVETIPDIEKLASDYLRTHPDVLAITDRVVGKPPSSTDTPWVQVVKLDAANHPSSIPERLIAYLVQLDCYAGKDGGQPEANTLARTVRGALIDMPGTFADAIVTSARVIGDARIPDPDVDEPARDRVILTARIHAHG